MGHCKTNGRIQSFIDPFSVKTDPLNPANHIPGLTTKECEIRKLGQLVWGNGAGNQPRAGFSFQLSDGANIPYANRIYSSNGQNTDWKAYLVPDHYDVNGNFVAKHYEANLYGAFTDAAHCGVPGNPGAIGRPVWYENAAGQPLLGPPYNHP